MSAGQAVAAVAHLAMSGFTGSEKNSAALYALWLYPPPGSMPMMPL
jgi:hypothetical protein